MNYGIVKDITKRIFVIESPTIEDVENNKILSDKSGMLMSKNIYNKDIPFGYLVESNPIAATDGIVSICNFPLDFNQVFRHKPIEIFGYSTIFQFFLKTADMSSTINYTRRVDTLGLIDNLNRDITQFTIDTDLEEIVICGVEAMCFMSNAFPNLRGLSTNVWFDTLIGEKTIRVIYVTSPRNRIWTKQFSTNG
ncbi:MAG: hypothetical protein IT221_15485 [Fluviicola sp.]|nr:hypothetical protein [Fluviicola sp.]